MIPLFTPATARKDVNKTPGDGELAKLANLNRLVENVNTIVAQGIPAAGPTLTYTNVGALDSMYISFGVSVSPADIPNSGGTKTVQSYYVPTIGLSSVNNSNSALTSISFPDIKISGVIQVNSVPNLDAVRFPALEKVLGTFSIDQPGTVGISTVSLPLLNYVSVDFFFNYLDIPNANYPLVTFIGRDLNLTHLDNITSVNFPLLTFVGGNLLVSNTNSLSTFNFPLLISTQSLEIGNVPAIASINLSSLTSASNGIYIYNTTLPATLNLSNIDQPMGGDISIGNTQEVTTIDLSSIPTSGGVFISNCDAVTTINLASLTSSHNNGNSAELNFNTLPSLTSLNLSNLTYCDRFTISDTGLTSLNLPSLTSSNNQLSISGDYIQSISTPSVTSTYAGLDLSSLPVLTSLTLSNTVVTLTLTDCPLLTSITSNATTAFIGLHGTNGLSSINLPNLTTLEFVTNGASSFAGTSLSLPSVTTLQLFCGQSALTSISFANATTSDKFYYASSTTTTSINLPSMVEYTCDEYSEVQIAGNTNLTSLVLGTIGTLKKVGGQIIASGCAFSETSVNNLLALLVSLDGTNGTTLFNYIVQIQGGTSSAPTGQGLIDKATLQARGCTIDTN